MRTSEAALAVIRNQGQVGGPPRWLARWNAKWGAFHFAGGHRHEGESFRDCLARELLEELGLREGADYAVGPGPPARLEYSAWSQSARAETHYTIELFPVDLREPGRSVFESRAETRWLDDATIRSGRCDDGRPVSPTMEILIAKAGLRVMGGMLTSA